MEELKRVNFDIEERKSELQYLDGLTNDNMRGAVR
jgi:hypothetical protein